MCVHVLCACRYLSLVRVLINWPAVRRTDGRNGGYQSPAERSMNGNGAWRVRGARQRTERSYIQLNRQRRRIVFVAPVRGGFSTSPFVALVRQSVQTIEQIRASVEGRRRRHFYRGACSELSVGVYAQY